MQKPMPDTDTGKTGVKSARGRGFGILFFGFFLLLGSLFTVMLVREVYLTAVTYGWDATECEIIASEALVDREAPSDQPPYSFSVAYSYQWMGNTYKSNSLALDRPAYNDWDKIRRLQKRYPANSRVACYVNPKDPSQAILQRRGFWLALAIPLPLIFVLIGGGGIYATWFRSGSASKRIKSISDKAPSPKLRWVLPVMFAGFLVIGAGVFLGLFARPIWELTHSAQWRPLPCQIEFSRVAENEGDDSTTYSVEILFSYQVDGEPYRSSRFRFFQISSSGYADKRDTVRQYPRGSETTCYVDPDDPEQAVVDRSFTPAILLGLIPFTFVIVGLGGILHQWNKFRPASVKDFSAAPAGAVGPLVLEPKTGRWGKLLGALLFACFWNGIVSVFLYQVIRGWMRGHFEILLALFLVPFVLAGLGAIGAVIYFFLGLFNPRIRLELNRAALRPGDSVSLNWTVSGKVSTISRIRITLEGKEEINYRKGKNNRVEKHNIAENEVINHPAPITAQSRQTRVIIPADAMHTHEGDHNKILWLLHVKGDVRRWPDIDAEFPIRMLAGRAGQAPGFRKARRLTASPLRINTRRTEFQPGEIIDGSIEWKLPEVPDNLELRLFWYTTGKGDEDVEIAASEQINTQAAAGRQLFRLQIPKVPVSYKGTLFSIHWALELVAKPSDETARLDLFVSPNAALSE